MSMLLLERIRLVRNRYLAEQGREPSVDEVEVELAGVEAEDGRGLRRQTVVVWLGYLRRQTGPV